MTPPYRRYAPVERLEGPLEPPESREDSVCEHCGQFYWFCQGHPALEDHAE